MFWRHLKKKVDIYENVQPCLRNTFFWLHKHCVPDSSLWSYNSLYKYTFGLQKAYPLALQSVLYAIKRGVKTTLCGEKKRLGPYWKYRDKAPILLGELTIVTPIEANFLQKQSRVTLCPGARSKRLKNISVISKQ